MKKVISIISALALLAGSLCACGSVAASQSSASVPMAERTRIGVWCTDDGGALWDNFCGLVSQYNSGAGASAGVIVMAESYPSDAALIKALGAAGSRAPDLVICSLESALDLEAGGTAVSTDKYFSASDLSGVDAACLAAGTVGGRLMCVPAAFSPYMLMINADLAPESNGYGADSLSTLEGLCAAAQKYNDAAGKHFFTADSFTSLFCTGLAQYGDVFHASREQNIKNKHFVYIYNLLAEAAYNGGVTSSGGEAAQLTAQGGMACAAVTAAEIMICGSASGAGTTAVLPFPVVQGGAKLYPSAVWEMSVTSGNDAGQKSAAKFASWLFGKGAELCGQSGWYSPSAPLSSVSAGSAGGLFGTVTAAAAAMGSQYAPTYQTPSADNSKNNAQFEASFRETLSVLN